MPKETGFLAESCERPHEILGLRAGEIDPVVIIDASRMKLRAIRAANGSEFAVRRAIESLIIHARDCLLANAYAHGHDDSPPRDRETGRAAVAVGVAAWEGAAHPM